MILDIDPEIIIKEIGTNGEEEWFPGTNTPNRGINIQELIDVCLRRGYALTPIHFYPANAPQYRADKAKQIYTDEECQERFWNHLKTHRAIIIGTTTKGILHAVAWEYPSIYNPHGWVTITNKHSINDPGINIIEAWILLRIKSN